MCIEIVDDIVKDISNGEYSPDEKLPSENELALKYKTTRYDVRKAFDRLTEMGYIYSLQGKGRYYQSKKSKIELLLTGDESFTDKMIRSGYLLETHNIQFTELMKAPKARAKLGVSKENRVFKISRLRMIDGEPAAIHISFVSDKLFPTMCDDGKEIRSMFEYYKQHGYNEYYYRESNLQTMIPTRYERELLNCPSLVP
ncbi:MAG: GntR family transcriptional regulator, partial [Vallitaleaceae bacterium]|nr:GntR family transcriptional regulator [Vallitaleaceae bacterium]